MTKQQKQEAQEARDRLLAILKPGDTVYCVLKHVSRSGMQREIAIYHMPPEGSPSWLVGYASRVLGMRRGSRDGLVVGGCGMDMGFHIVYNLSHALWPNGAPCIGERCPSNDHNNGDRDFTPHGHRGPRYDGTRESLAHWHKDGGYTLRSAWL